MVTDISLFYQGDSPRVLDFIVSDRCLLGFHSDLNATYPVGTVDEESAKLIQTTRECLDAAIRVCKPGALFRDIGKAMLVPLMTHVSNR